MALTREQLAAMSEEQLRKEVLIPLFEAMGYRDVHHYHGGPLEQGKDIVMWKPGDIRDRVNYGVVVKANKISGQVTGKSGTSEVRTQIDQCFGTSYLDQVTSKEQRVDHCFVVSSQVIKKEAVSALKGILEKSNLARATDFIDGKKLWDLIEEYLPERTVMDKLQQVQNVFDEVDPYYRIIARTTVDRIELSLEPKSPDAEKEHPITITGHFVFPDTPEGLEKREQLERHIRTGVPVTLTKSFIQDLTLPEFLPPLLDPTGEGVGMVAMGPVRSSRPLLVSVEVEREDEDKVTLEYIHLELVQTGTEESTFTNDQQPVPWKIRLVYNIKEKRLQFDYSFVTTGVNVYQVLKSMRFGQALAEGGVLRIMLLETGFELQSYAFLPGTSTAPDSQWVKLVETLMFIQEKTGVPISIPDRELTDDDFRAIFGTAQILKTGQITYKAEELTIGIDKESAQTWLEAFEGSKAQTIHLHEVETTEKIFDVTIPLGSAILHLDQVYVTKKNLNALRAAISNNAPEESVHVHLTPSAGCTVKGEYSKWLSPT